MATWLRLHATTLLPLLRDAAIGDASMEQRLFTMRPLFMRALPCAPRLLIGGYELQKEKAPHAFRLAPRRCRHA